MRAAAQGSVRTRSTHATTVRSLVPVLPLFTQNHTTRLLSPYSCEVAIKAARKHLARPSGLSEILYAKSLFDQIYLLNSSLCVFDSFLIVRGLLRNPLRRRAALSDLGGDPTARVAQCISAVAWFYPISIVTPPVFRILTDCPCLTHLSVLCFVCVSVRIVRKC